MDKNLNHNYLENFLHDIRARDRYSFTLEELKKEFDLPYPTIKQSSRQEINIAKYYKI